MSLAGVEFAFFFPLVFLLYWLAPRRAGAQNAVLLAASYAFYASWRAELVAVLAVSTLVDWWLGRYLGARPRTGAARAATRWRQAALGLSLAVNLGALGYLKYSAFFAAALNDALSVVGLGTPLPRLEVFLVIGISYYTLVKIGYIVDVYYERIRPTPSLLTFATFTAFFPQLMAGPITRGRQMLPQFGAARRLNPDMLRAGAATFLLGYALKAFVADGLGPLVVDPVFSAPGTHTAGAHWLAIAGYAAQVFGDFAGYSLLAIGCGRTFGIELPENFNYPFLSRNIMEFWRRWHITLTAWLFDYLYAPLVTGQGWLRGRVATGLVVIFLVSGLWHGATWGFVAWGLMQGLGLAAHYWWDVFYKQLCRRDRVWIARRRTSAYQGAAWLVTQTFFLLTLTLFRSPNLASAARFARGLLPGAGTTTLTIPTTSDLLLILAVAVFLVGYHLLELLPVGRAAWARFQALPPFVRGIGYGAAIVILLLLTPVGTGTFIYAQF